MYSIIVKAIYKEKQLKIKDHCSYKSKEKPEEVNFRWNTFILNSWAMWSLVMVTEI